MRYGVLISTLVLRVEPMQDCKICLVFCGDRQWGPVQRGVAVWTMMRHPRQALPAVRPVW